MKSIKNYIVNSLNESILDSDDVYLSGADKLVVEEWIKDNYEFSDKLVISDDLVVDCRGDVNVINEKVESLTNGLFRWGEVGGMFNCSSCENITSLEGSPKKVGEDFYCGSCNKLTSLEGAPEEVGGIFNCRYCDNLKSLEGAPKKVYDKFYCGHCKKLKITRSDRKKYNIEN